MTARRSIPDARYGGEGGRKNRERITPTKLRQWLRQLHMTPAACAAYLNVEPSTVRRWLSGRARVPGPAITALQMLRWHSVPPR